MFDQLMETFLIASTVDCATGIAGVVGLFRCENKNIQKKM